MCCLCKAFLRCRRFQRFTGLGGLVLGEFWASRIIRVQGLPGLSEKPCS